MSYHVGIIVRDHRVVDVMSYPDHNQVLDNMHDSPHIKGADSASIFKVDLDGNAERVGEADTE